MKKLIFVSSAIAILLISILSSQYSHGRGGGGRGGHGGGRGGHGGGRGGGGGGRGKHDGGRGGHNGGRGYGHGYYSGWGYNGWSTGLGIGLTTGVLVGAAASSGGGDTYNYYSQDNQSGNYAQQDGQPSFVQMTNNTGDMITVKSLTTGDTASINPGVTTKLEGPSNGFQFEVRNAKGKLIRTGASNNGAISIR